MAASQEKMPTITDIVDVSMEIDVNGEANQYVVIEDMSKTTENNTVKTENNIKDEAAQLVVSEDSPLEDGKKDKECASVQENSEGNIKDPYHYLKDDEYSTERFKVVIENVPPKMNFAQMKKYFTSKLGYAPRKIKHQPYAQYAFLAFRNDEEREKAIEKLNGLVWRNKTITCKKAAPAKDPYLNKNRKRKNLDPEEEERRSKVQSLPYADRVPHTVCPWFEIPYEEQLKRKQGEAEQLLKNLTATLKKDDCVDEQWVKDLRYGNMPCELLPIIAAPQKLHYRNKNEFSIGCGAENKDNTLGFRLGKYSEGCRIVVEPSKAVIVPEVSLTIAKEFQEYLWKQDLPSHDLRAHTGYWQQLTVRCVTDESGHPETMVIVQMHRQSLTEEQLKEVKSNLVAHFTSDERKAKVSSIYFSYSSANNNAIDVYEHLAGLEYIHQDMVGLKFRISCDSFFQVNVSAAELLYKKVIEWVEDEAKVKEISHVLDVCCGTGTIGLSIAKNSPECKVVGVDCCKRAIEDALANQSLNNIDNAHFACGTAESILQNLVRQQNCKGNMVAVVDPPRAGLHQSVVNCLREQASINKIIFVSCSPKQAMNNFLNFVRCKSKRRPGGPFRLTRAIPVDLFPQTPHCEMVLEFTRLPPKAKIEPNVGEVQVQNASVSVEQGSDVKKESESDTSSNGNPQVS